MGELPTTRFRARTHNIRVAMGWTQADLSTKTGIERTRISRIEGGQCGVTLDEAVTICKALNMEMPEMVGDGEVFIRVRV